MESSKTKLDLTSLKCPMPIIETNKMIKKLSPGEEMLVCADDPAFCLDIEAWCKQTGNELIRFESSGNTCTAIIRKKG